MAGRHQQRRSQTAGRLAWPRVRCEQHHPRHHRPRRHVGHVHSQRRLQLHRHHHVQRQARQLHRHRHTPRRRRAPHRPHHRVRQSGHGFRKRCAGPRLRDPHAHRHRRRAAIQRQHRRGSDRHRGHVRYVPHSLHRGSRHPAAAHQLSWNVPRHDGDLHRPQQQRGTRL